MNKPQVICNFCINVFPIEPSLPTEFYLKVKKEGSKSVWVCHKCQEVFSGKFC